MDDNTSTLQVSELEDALSLLTQMYRIRFLEEKITELRKKQDIQGSVHLCNGQEAIYVGARAALTAQDRIFSTYRGHGWALACGVPPAGILGELLGRESGVCKGRGGSAYFSAADWGFYGENSIVGAGAPIACGAALASQFAQDGSLALTAFGDGAINQGAIAEALNFAAYLRLPLIFVCENNTYAELTPLAETVKDPMLFRRARGYGINGLRIDGNDVHAVRDCIAHCAKEVREGKGPVLIEMMTQRLVGHYYGDLQSYRPAGELLAAQKVEPLVRLKERLLKSGVHEHEVAEREDQARKEIEQAASEALAQPLAHVASVREHLYA